MRYLLIAVLLPLVGWAQLPKAGGFQIKGQLEGLQDNTTVVLLSGLDGKKIASATASKGVFVLSGKLPGAEICQLSFTGRHEALDFFMDVNDQLSINGSFAALGAAEIKGSAVQEDYELFKRRFNPLKDKLNGVAALIDPEKDPVKRDSLIAVFNRYKNEVIAATAGFISEKPASQVSAFILFVTSPLMTGINEVEANYNQLQPLVQKGTYGKLLAKNIADAKVGMIGSQALAFTQKDTANKPVSLAAFKGKYVLVDFWASWCGPCRMENPNVVKAYEQYKDKNFTILGVSLDQHRDKWLQAIKADRLNWTHVSDLQYWNNEVARLYHIQSIPANMLIDPSGKIIARDLRSEELHATLQRILK